MGSIAKRPDGRYRARYRDADGKEYAKHFPDGKKRLAEAWLTKQEAALLDGRHIAPDKAKITVGEWAATWLEGYGQNRDSTVRQAKTHLKHITAQFGDRELSSVRPSEIKSWTTKLKNQGLADSTVRAVFTRMRQLYSDAIEDGIVTRSPLTKKTAPKAGKQRPYVATTEQIWALHEGMPEGLRPAVLLAAFAGLRIAEVVALEVRDVDFMAATITPVRQYGGLELKTETSKSPVPVSRELLTELNRMPAKFGASAVVLGDHGRPVSPHTVNEHFRRAKDSVEGLPAEFRFHDLRHYYASLLISKSLDIKTVQHCMRHGSAKTTLDVYGHMFPDTKESARAAVTEVLAARADHLRTEAS